MAVGMVYVVRDGGCADQQRQSELLAMGKLAEYVPLPVFPSFNYRAVVQTAVSGHNFATNPALAIDFEGGVRIPRW